MKTIVLDDDPTGTQSASGVTVLLESNAELLTAALAEADSVYVQTNSRAIPEADAVALVTRVRADGLAAARRLDCEVQFVLRGDSTLRGHVFAESAVFMDEDAVLVFSPAFPAGGRTTVGGVHLVDVGGVLRPAHETEYADDPVFGFRTGVLVDYVGEKSGRRALSVPLADVRSGELGERLRSAAPGTVVLPDAETDADIDAIARAIVSARATGRSVVVRSAAPLAAALAGVAGDGLLPFPLLDAPRATLLVCGSHTAGATAQLEPVIARHGTPAVIDTGLALADPARASEAAVTSARVALERTGLAVLMTERARSGLHNTLDHGARVMSALTGAVHALVPAADVVIAKGGITSADVARLGIGARSALVLGQIVPGVSVWELTAFDGHRVLYVVVPGNVGGPDTLTRLLTAVGITGAAEGQA